MGGYTGFGAPDPDERDIELFETILSGDLLGNDGPDFANNGYSTYNADMTHLAGGAGPHQYPCSWNKAYN